MTNEQRVKNKIDAAVTAILDAVVISVMGGTPITMAEVLAEVTTQCNNMANEAAEVLSQTGDLK